jgi:hypothetical protein
MNKHVLLIALCAFLCLVASLIGGLPWGGP